MYLGLLLLTEDQFGKGLGRRSFDLIEHYVKNVHGVTRIRLGISDENDVTTFWTKLGFAANGKTYAWLGENKRTTVVEYEKPLVTS